MLLFRSEEHVDRWCKVWGLSRAATLSPQQAWELAKAWYSMDRRDPAWRRPTVEEAESLLASLNLSGPFWNLR